MSEILGRAHQMLGRSSVVTRLALLARNQLNQIIHRSLSDGPDCRTNGEAWLIRQRAKPSDVFVDVGANVGEWSALYLKASGGHARGILYEPSGSACLALRTRFGPHLGIEIVNAAVSDTEGMFPFYEEADAGTHSSLVQSFASSQATEQSVRVTTLDAEAERLALGRIDFLKIDCEGYDLHVLRGAERLLSGQRIRMIQYEYNAPWKEAGSTLARAIRFLEGYGYYVQLLKADGLHPFDAERYGEFFACATFVASSGRDA